MARPLALNGFDGTINVQSGFGSAAGAVRDDGAVDDEGVDDGGVDDGAVADAAVDDEVGATPDELAAADNGVVAAGAGELVTIAKAAAIAATATTGAMIDGRNRAARKKRLRGSPDKPR